MVSSKRVYGLTTPFVSVFPDPITKTAAPTASDKNYPNGFVWIYQNGDTRTQYTYGGLDSSGDAVWILAGPGASDVDLLKGNSGTATPAGGIINILGGTNVTTVGASPTGDDLTINLDASITLATQVSSPIYTVAAATDMNINAASGQDVIMVLGDNAGAKSFIIQDSALSPVFTVNSSGALTFSSLTVSGAFTQTAGVVSISEDNSANAVGIANGTVARAVTFASSAAAHTVAMGSATGAASLDLKAGTGNFTLDGDAATTYTVGASTTGGTISIGGTAQTGTMTLGDSSGINIVQIGSGEGATTVNIAGGATAAKVVNIATGAVANLVTIGSASGAASLDLLCGTGNFTLEGATASTYDISATGANTGTVTIAAGTGARIVNLATGGTGAKTVNIATGAIGNIVTMGTVTAAASLDLLCGTGNFSLEGNVASTYDISATGVNTGTVTIAAGTGARTVNLATGGTGAKTVNIATGAIGNIVTIGSVTAAASLDLKCGTGNFTLEGATASTYDISATGANTGAITISGGTGAQTTNIATGGTGIKTVNVGTGAIGNVITMGTVTGAASLDLKCGTGNFTLEGDVASTYEISSTGVNTGTCKFASGTGARTVEIAGGGTGIKTVNIAAAATADVITIGTTTAAGATTISAGTGGLSLQSGLTVAVTAVATAATPYAVLGGDYVIATTTSAGVLTLTLPAAPATGRTIVVVDESGNAAANNVTVDGNGKSIAAGGTTAATKAIDSNYGTMTLYYTGTIWNAQDIA